MGLFIKKNGRWIRKEHLFSKDEYECSCCHAVFRSVSKTCPKCKASMKGYSSDPLWVDELEMFDAIFDDGD